jgi:hypothetical protein
MISRRKALDSLTKLIEHRSDSDQLFQLLQSFNLGPEFPDLSLPKFNHDHTVAIVTASILETALELAIIPKFPKISSEDQKLLFSDSKEGPLSTFSAKIRIAHALGIFGNAMRDDLITIKAIRNLFAHARGPIDFDNQAVIDACAALYILQQGLWSGGILPTPATAKDRYLQAAMMYFLSLGSDPEADPETYQFWADIAFWQPPSSNQPSARLPRDLQS